MSFKVWFARGYINSTLLSEHNDFTAAVMAANSAAYTGIEDIEVINAQDQVIYRIGFSKLNEFVELNWTAELEISMTCATKLYTVAGTSIKNGKTKIRFSSDLAVRTKTLIATGDTEINLIELPKEMTKVQAVQYMQSHVDFSQEYEQMAFVDFLNKNIPISQVSTTVEEASEEQTWSNKYGVGLSLLRICLSFKQVTTNTEGVALCILQHIATTHSRCIRSKYTSVVVVNDFVYASKHFCKGITMTLTIEGFLKGSWYTLVSYSSDGSENRVQYAKIENMVDELQEVIRTCYSTGSAGQITVNDTVINVLRFDAMRVKLVKWMLLYF